jgi:glucose/arabinose dehydrogenase
VTGETTRGWPRLLAVAFALVLVASGCTFVGQASPVPAASGDSNAQGSLPPTEIPPTEAPVTAVPPTEAPTEAAATETPTEAPGTAVPTPRRSASPRPAAFRPGRVRLRLESLIDVGSDAQPVYLTGDGTGEGRLYLVLRGGLIRILDRKGKITGTLIDLRDRVGTDGERGLHAVAFHPRFARNGRFYVHYNTPSGDTRVVEYRQRRPGQEVNAGSGQVIFDFGRPEWNHNGGWLGFGPDGYLYIASGDGGGNSPGDPFGNGQDKNDLFGSILRIDVDEGNPYAIPRDNPFRGKAGRDELWNYGLRNPWRASFDTLTGDLWIGDVGQDRVEEIDIQREGKGGLNFGWSVMEGSRCHQRAECSTRGLTMPVTEYTHGARGCSVTGGYVYRGTESPVLYGAYLFSDYCSSTIWAIDASKAKAGAKLKPRRLLRRQGSSFVSFGQDDEGELYVVSIGGGVYKLVGRERR